MQVDVNGWTGSARNKHRVFVLLMPELGGVLTRVELQPPWSGAGRVAGYGRNTGLGSACGRSGVLPAVDGRGLRSHCRIPAVLFQDQLLKV